MKPLTRRTTDGVHVAFVWQTNAGKPSPTYGYRVAKVRLRVAVNRYNCAMTVSGWYRHLSHTDQPGASCSVYGAFADGRLCVMMPYGGCCTLGTEDVEVVDASALTEEERAYLAALPLVSRVEAAEILEDERLVVEVGHGSAAGPPGEGPA